jgi:hypothetical protein
MKIIDNIKKTISNLPGIRRPQDHSLYYAFMGNYGWTQRRSDKPRGDFEVYYEALNNVYVHRCIQVEIDSLLATGFQINNLDEDEINIARTNYLYNLFNNPGGYKSEITYPMFHSQYIRAFEGTGDAFIEVNHEELFQHKVPTGLTYVPSDLLKWYPDTDQWGYREMPNIRYEPEELIHIHEPDIQMKSSKWGMCKIDKIGLAISIMFLGMRYNKDIMENDGIDPKAILSFDKDMDNDSFMNELNRLSSLKKEQKKGGTLAVKGGQFTSAGVNARDMDWNKLITMSRDMIITGYGAQPAMVGVIETANLGSGTQEGQKKNFKDTLQGRAAFIEGAFNKSLGHNGFDELFKFSDMDIEDKLNRAQIENIRLQNGSLSINEVRSGYGEQPVPWGNVPMNYNNYGYTPNILNPTTIEPLGATGIDKAIDTVQRYKSQLYSSDIINYKGD